MQEYAETVAYDSETRDTMLVARYLNTPKGQVLLTEGAGALHIQQSNVEQVIVLHSPTSLILTRL